MVDALRAALAQVTVSEEPPTPRSLPAPQGEQGESTAQEATAAHSDAGRANKGEQGASAQDDEGEQEANNYQRVKAYLATHPEATDRDIANALAISSSTANKWRNRVKEA